MVCLRKRQQQGCATDILSVPSEDLLPILGSLHLSDSNSFRIGFSSTVPSQVGNRRPSRSMVCRSAKQLSTESCGFFLSMTVT